MTELVEKKLGSFICFFIQYIEYVVFKKNIKGNSTSQMGDILLLSCLNN